MDQIRFDFLGGIAGGNGRTGNANANGAETGDAFAQILDQQLTRRPDPGPERRSSDARSRNDAGDRADSQRPQASKPRDSKPAAASARPEAAAKPAPKAKPAEKAAESNACAKPAAKPDQDETTEAAAGAQATTGSADAGAAETEDSADTSGDTPQQQQGEGADQPAGDGSDQSETVGAEADLGLLAMLAVPLPLQTIAANADAAAVATPVAGGDAAAAALQAKLAAGLAGAIDLGAAASGKGQTQATPGGLKFGAILNAGLAQPQKAATDAVDALQDAAADLAQAGDPPAQPAPGTNGTTPRDSASSGPAKPRDASQGNAAAPVGSDQTGKATAAIVQPMNRAQAVTWSGTNVRNEVSESMAAQAGNPLVADDGEFSNWSQVLGSGAAGLGTTVAARQSAFMAQLKQNLQVLPPHEQIAVQIQNAMQNGNSRLTIGLHPAELGRVEVKLDIDKDKNVSATIVVDRPATLDLLRNDAKALERALQDAGLQTGSGSLSFSLRDSNGQGGGAQNGGGTGGGSGAASGGSDVKADAVRADVVATADGYVDLET